METLDVPQGCQHGHDVVIEPQQSDVTESGNSHNASSECIDDKVVLHDQIHVGVTHALVFERSRDQFEGKVKSRPAQIRHKGSTYTVTALVRSSIHFECQSSFNT